MRVPFLTCALATLPFVTAAIPAPARENYGTIRTTTSGGVVRASIYNPPINLYDYKLATDLHNFLLSLNQTGAPKVVIFESADPQFFIAHFDFSSSLPPSTPEKDALPNLYIDTARLLRDITTTVFIGQVAGQAFGAGNELLVQMDMRFAGPGTRLGSIEPGIGQFHGVGGLQYLTKLIGRGRAAEYLFSTNNIDGPTAASIGWVNRYYDSNKTLNDAVDALAHRIATFPLGALNATKAGLNAAGPPQSAIDSDLNRLFALLASPDSQTQIRKFLKASNNQTRGAFELGLSANLVDLFV
jgi:enoyl-CoA hydratase/carnithine racemase